MLRESSTLTSKGQMTLPVGIRKALNLEAGDRVEFVVYEDGVIEMRPMNRPAAGIIGRLAAYRRKLAPEDYDRALGRAIAARGAPERKRKTG